MLRALLFCLLAACSTGSVRSVDGALEGPERVTFEPTYVGFSTSVEVELVNHARFTRDVHLSVDPPFSVAPSLRLGPGERLSFPVLVSPLEEGPLTGALVLGVDGESSRVALTGLALAPPVCTSSDCIERHFEPGRGCVEVPRRDGDACGAADQCLVQAVCRQGECVGAPRSCDDGNACTTDACSPATGCTHAEQACSPPTDPCLTSVCDPRTGCQTVPVLDGVACGPNDCTTARVCLRGACVVREAPEGSICAPATACHPEARCLNGSCSTPPGATPPVAWSRAPTPGRTVVAHAVARDGTVLFYDGPTMRSAPPVLRAITKAGALRFEVDHAAGFPNSVQHGIVMTVDDAHGLLFSAVSVRPPGGPGSTSVITARDLRTGELRWTHDLAADIARVDGPQLELAAQRMLRLGSERVGVLIQEGNSLHTLHVVALEAATGAVAFQVQQPGHGTAGAAADGTLFFASAPCWTDDTRVTTFDRDGRLVARRALVISPTAFTTDGALVREADGRHAFMSRDLQSTPVAVPMGHVLRGGTFVWRRDELTAVTTGNGLFVTRSTGSTFDWSTRVSPSLTDRVSLQGLSERRTAVTVWGAASEPTQLVVLSANGAELDRCVLRPGVGVELSGGVLVTRGSAGFEVYATPTLDGAHEGWVGQNGGPQSTNSAL